MSVVGLDIGNLSCYVAVAVGGGIETVANEYSDRCTPSYVSLNERNRCMGVSAKNQSTTNLKNTISCFKRLLGRQFSDPQVQTEINNYVKPYKIVEGKGGETLIQAMYMGELQEFMPEQLMAMILTKLKETAESGLKTKVVDVVVSVPSFFTDVERKAMIASCQMAGLNCLKVMNDTTAVSLAYGIYKQDLPAENEKARNVIFVDLGYSSLQVAATAFNKGKLKVLALASDENVGGRDFDKLIVDHFIEEWKKKYKIDVLKKPKAYIRLTQESEKLKKLMSANSQPIPINIECFIDDKDVTGKLERAVFEEMATSLLKKAEVVFKRILEASMLSKDDIYSVEIVGGCSRIPCIKELVNSVFGKEPSTTLNADEAVAKGCALQYFLTRLVNTDLVNKHIIKFLFTSFIHLETLNEEEEEETREPKKSVCQRVKWSSKEEAEIREYFKDNFETRTTPGKLECELAINKSKSKKGVLHRRNWETLKKKCAILSPTFRVRDFTIQDCQPYSITLSWQGGGMDDDSSLEVFPQYHQIPFSKMLTFYRKEPFTLEARYTDPKSVSIKDPGIGMFTISKVQPQASGESSKVKVKVRVNNQGIFTVQSASMVEKLDSKDEEQSESMETDPQKEEPGEANANDAAMDTEQQQQNTEEQGPDAKDEEMKTDKDDDKKKDDKKDEKKKKKPSSRSIDLPVEAHISVYTRDAINLLIERENNMIMQDRLEKERADAKNAVEEYVYDMRDKLCGPYEQFCKEEDRENFSKLLGETEDWLYDEGEDQNKQVYLDKLAELRKTGDPIASRYRESQERPSAFESLGASLQILRKFISSWESKDEKYIHIEKEDIDKVNKCLKEKSEWFEKQMNAQNVLKKFEPPVVLASQIRQTQQAIESTCSPIMNKPKPKPKEEPPKEDAKKEEGAVNGEQKPADASKASGDKSADSQKSTGTSEMEVD